ncbi:MAG: S9 family peptidase [Gemmataceae bacterium]|nr:S9 family peptidase [Gemmataceae bacterium]
MLCSLNSLLAGPLTYPKTQQGPQVDNHHGTMVPDPYRWLEDDVRNSPAVRAWVEEENKVTNAFLAGIPQREAIRKRLTELWDYEKVSAPVVRNGRYFYLRNNGLQNQAVLYVQDGLQGNPRVLIDPNILTKDGTVALASWAPSYDGKLLAYALAEAGSDWNTWKILEVDSGKSLPDELKWVKFSTPTWLPDGKGFYYSRFDEPPQGAQFQGLNLNQKVYFHKVRTAQTEDPLVYSRPDHPDWGFQTEVTEDGQYLVLTVWKGTDDNYRITYFDLKKPGGQAVDLIDHFEDEYTLAGNQGNIFYFKTNRDAPLGKLVAIDVNKPSRENWQLLIPEGKENLQSVNLVGGKFAASYLKDARTEIRLFSLDGKTFQDIQLPGIGTAAGFGGKEDAKETFYSFSSFATPPVIFRHDFTTGKSEVFRDTKVKFNSADYQVEQVFYKGKDGARVPMFLTYKKGLKKDGKNPMLLYGYGGFNISLTPAFSASRIGWLELGGVLAVANLRGGGEYGEKWHKAGVKLQKQNVFDDFIAAAEWLIGQKYTQPSKLAIQGGSNGGLLVGACMTQRPELFGACLPAVGVMDMLRFHKFTAGRFWVDDYGSADNPEEFKALFAYSPYHNLKKGVKYPPTLITTADTDDRVVPGHSFKFAARLQEYHEGNNPVLIRIETRAGHGAGKPTAKIIEEVADQWGFLVKNLGMTD